MTIQPQPLDKEKAIEVLLYVVKRCSDVYRALKIIYFADKEHLSRYGRLIFGDRYVAMSHGAVPSYAYDIVKMGRGVSDFTNKEVKEALSVDGNIIAAKRDPSLEILSESEIECLDSAIAEYSMMSFLTLKSRAHKQKDYKSADENDFISFEDLVHSVKDGKLLWQHLTQD